MVSAYFWCYYHQDLGLQVPNIKVLIYQWRYVYMQYWNPRSYILPHSVM